MGDHARMSHVDLSELGTEARNPRSEQLDAMSTLDLVTTMNDEDRLVADAVRAQLPQIAATVDAISQRMREGGRMIYVGAGTSGRLGVLDAAECPPTFSSDPSQVLGLIAGGERALLKAVEGAEDDPQLAAADLDTEVVTQRLASEPLFLAAHWPGPADLRESPLVSSDLVEMLRDVLKAGEPGRPLEHLRLTFWRIPEGYPDVGA